MTPLHHDPLWHGARNVVTWLVICAVFWLAIWGMMR